MESYISTELNVFLWSVISGVFMAIAHDILCVMTSKSRYSVFVCNVCDGIFVICASTIMIFILFSVSNGYVRVYEFIGAFIGAFLYKFTLSRVVTALLTEVFRGIFAIFNFFLKILLTPIRFMYKIMYNSISVLCVFVCRIFRPVFNKAKRIFKVFRITLKRT
ncbi:MAG: hypothetical protein J6R66_00020 [Clostridia bacterium]|nr:hypothetical protein [Clostridia bacterium]